MLTEKSILDTLNNTLSDGLSNSLLDLGHPYSYLIDARINIFRGEDNRWAIVGEKLGFNPRAGGILLDICYFGNCIRNLESDNGRSYNWYSVSPINRESLHEAFDNEYLKPTAEYLLVRGEKLPLSYNKRDYLDAGVELKEYEPDAISPEEVGRLLITRYSSLFRATDEELYKSIPDDLQKILVIDEWYHRDYMPLYEPRVNEFYINMSYGVAKQFSADENVPDYESFALQYKEDEQRKYEKGLKEWRHSLPGAYETWQQIAKVIVTRDPSNYKPTVKPNSHWRFWPESGSL